VSKSNATSGQGIIVACNATTALLEPVQRAADARGHGPETAASGCGGLIGGIVGSFAGPLDAAIGASAGAGLGFLIAGGTSARP
jgi:hypothetical protein